MLLMERFCHALLWSTTHYKRGRMHLKDQQPALIRVYNCFLPSLGFAFLCHMRRSLWEQVSFTRLKFSFSACRTVKRSHQGFSLHSSSFPHSRPSGPGPRPAGRRRGALFCPQLGCHLRFSLQRHAAVPPQPRQGGDHCGETRRPTPNVGLCGFREQNWHINIQVLYL